METITTELFNELKKTATTIAAGWIVTLPNGTQYGFTTASQQFTMDGLVFSPINGFSPTAIQSKTDLSVGNMEMTAVLDADFTDEQLRGGYFDGTTVKSFWLNPDHPEYGVLPLQVGTVGQLDVRQVDYIAELRSLTQQLQQPQGRVYSLYCDAIFGSKRCGYPLNAQPWVANMNAIAQIATDARYGTIVYPTVPNGFWYLCTAAVGGTTTITSSESVSTLSPNTGLLAFLASVFDFPEGVTGSNYTAYQNLVIDNGAAGATEPVWPTVAGETVTDNQLTWTAVRARTVPGAVSAVSNRAAFVSSTIGAWTVNYFQYGTLTWTSGQNIGLSMDISSHTVSNGNAVINLLVPMPFPITVGDEFTIVQGCARNRQACLSNQNIENMRGCPDMPTEDLAMTTPNYSSDYNRGKK